MERFLEFLGEMGRMFAAAAAAARQALRSRYVRELESEVARLRAENRALVNSLIGTAGIPPLRFDAPAAPEAPPRQMPARRRSWQQVGRMLEIEEARRQREFSRQAEARPARPSAGEPRGAAKPNGGA